MVDNEALVVCLVADLLDRSRIQGVARAVGTPIAFAASPDALVSAVTAQTRVVFIDLNDTKVHGVDGVTKLLSAHSDAAGRPTIIGFASHTDEAGMAAAREAGCDEVLSRAQFFRRLSVVLAEAGEPR